MFAGLSISLTILFFSLLLYKNYLFNQIKIENKFTEWSKDHEDYLTDTNDPNYKRLKIVNLFVVAGFILWVMSMIASFLL